ncbi:DUF6492 family protein [Rhodoferax sp.]|uniref:DUF6492 family protein n=1 Tax=Rhodoferax sp. TaxID=50421 RepID=UPI00271AEBEF|nr:DUF6492 family protein [Rhodoferax sp.]MDO9198373.1 DUF6492 family protein [Rhodoferax sp.]
MKLFVLYCKSYKTDVKRVVRLAESIATFNIQNISFFVSAPRSDLPLFKEYLNGRNVELIADEDIVKSSPRLDPQRLWQLPGSLSQQIIKSEFWRLGASTAYLCIDSDSLFIRPFQASEFITPEGIPYTMMDEGRDLLEDALLNKKPKVIHDFQIEAELIQRLFDRVGRRYSFGPFPLVWHRAVWESLDTEYLQPRGMNFVDAILQAPIESRWYGEALLRYQAVPLMPCQPLFKVYHYAWQLDRDLRSNIGSDQLAQLYSGVIYQSAWEREMDWPSEAGNWPSRVARRLRRSLGRV